MILKLEELGPLDTGWAQATVSAKDSMALKTQRECAEWNSEVRGDLCVVIYLASDHQDLITRGLLGAALQQQHDCIGGRVLVVACGPFAAGVELSDLRAFLGNLHGQIHHRTNSAHANDATELENELARAMSVSSEIPSHAKESDYASSPQVDQSMYPLMGGFHW